MKKYTIEIEGKGSECFLFLLDKLEKENLKTEMNLTEDIVCSILGINSISESDRIISGYDIKPTNYTLVIKNFNDDVIWKSDINWDWGQKINLPIEYNTDILVVEDDIEGVLFSYELELEKDIDPNKITPIITNINNTIELITDLEYDGMDITTFKTYLDDYEQTQTIFKLS